MRANMQLEHEYFDKFVVEFRSTCKRYKFNPFVVDCLVATCCQLIEPAVGQIQDSLKLDERVKFVKWSWPSNVPNYFVEKLKVTDDLNRQAGPAADIGSGPAGALPGPQVEENVKEYFSAPLGAQRDPARAMSWLLHNSTKVAQMDKTMKGTGGAAFSVIQDTAQERKRY